MLKKILFAALLLPLLAFAQSYPSPTFNNLTVNGTFTLNGGVPPASLAAQAANTVLANVTAVSASPTAVALPSCSANASALIYTTSSGFGCRTNAAQTTQPLSQFAATTSAQLAGVISDETGSGSLVFSASPTLTGTLTATNITASGTLTGFPGRLLNVQIFTSSGTYTPTTGANSIVVFVQGGGGAGAGAAATGAGQGSCGSGGGSGAYAISRITSVSSQSITIGAGGTGALGTNGGNGGQSSFGAIITAPGGIGGTTGAATASTTGISSGGGNGGAVASGGTILNAGGQPGAAATQVLGTNIGGAGASSPFGGGGNYNFQATGTAATGRGAGGGGSVNNASQSATTGGAGTAGIVIVYEYQ